SVWIEGLRKSRSHKPVFCSHQALVNRAMLATVAKKSWARMACAEDTDGRRKDSTVKPPSKPCAMIAPSAATPNQRNHRLVGGRRDSTRHSQTASTMLSKPTKEAIMRWPCS